MSVAGATWGAPLLAAGLLAGCVPIDIPEPESLNLTYEAPRPHTTNVKIENGKGEVLYDGKPGAGRRIEANPTPEQLDGTLKVHTTLSDGTVRTQTLTHTAGKPVRIEYSDVSERYYVASSVAPAQEPSQAPQTYGSYKPFYGFADRPNTPFVRIESGGRILGFVESENSSSAPGFKGNVGIDFKRPLWGLGKKWGVELNGSYYNSKDETDIGRIPANGNNLAVFGPLAGGGVVTAQDLNDVRFSNDYWDWYGELRAWKEYDVGRLNGAPVTMRSYLGFMGGWTEVDEDLDLTIGNNFANLSSRAKMDNKYFGPTVGFNVMAPLGGGFGVYGGGFGRLNFNNVDASRTIDVRGGANLSGADALDTSETTVGGGARVGLSYDFGIFTGHVGGEYELRHTTPKIEIDQTTGDARVDIGSTDEFRLLLGFRAYY